MVSEKMEYTITQEKVIDILIHAANRQDFADFKRDMKQEFSEFKHEIKEDIAQFKNEVNGRIDKLDGRIDKLDGRIDKLMVLQVTTLLFVAGIIAGPFIGEFFKSWLR